MNSWLTIVAVPVALVLGLLGNARWVRRPDARDLADDEGFAISDLIAPITTLAVVLLAFMMVEALGSYGRARELVGREARIIDSFAETAGRVADRSTSQQLQATTICYARAVRGNEWTAMATGERSPAVSVWTGKLRELLASIRLGNGDAELDRLIDIDDARAEARLGRLAESKPTIPVGLDRLMFASVLVSVLGLAVFLKPKGSQVLKVGVLVVFACLTAGTLYMIDDLDRPFAGTNTIEPSDLARVMPGMEADFATQFPAAALPCDDQGVAT